MGERTYCCVCKPLKVVGNRVLCYFGHGLEGWRSKELLHCNKCGVNEKDFFKCHKCNYFVCEACFGEGDVQV